MPVYPPLAQRLPATLQRFTARLRYPHVFLASTLLFMVALAAARWLPYPEEILIALGGTMFVTSKWLAERKGPQA